MKEASRKLDKEASRKLNKESPPNTKIYTKVNQTGDILIKC